MAHTVLIEIRRAKGPYKYLWRTGSRGKSQQFTHPIQDDSALGLLLSDAVCGRGLTVKISPMPKPVKK